MTKPAVTNTDDDGLTWLDRWAVTIIFNDGVVEELVYVDENGNDFGVYDHVDIRAAIRAARNQQAECAAARLQPGEAVTQPSTPSPDAAGPNGALLSDCRTWRYSLWRTWDAALPTFVVIGLNPSTADETKDDPTIRRCISFAKREGCGKLVMLNLFAFRATRPADMFAAADPIGPVNDATIRNYAQEPTTRFAVAAWGAASVHHRGEKVAAMFDTLWCLGTTQSGQPRHPLYLHASTPLEHYRGFRA